MQIKYKILVLTSLPVLFIFSVAIMSQYIALKQTQKYIQEYVDILFKDQIMFSKQFTQSISQQLSLELQKMPHLLSVMNHYNSAILDGKVVFNDKYQPALMHMEMVYTNGENQEVINEYKKSDIFTSNWYHKNITKIQELRQECKDLIYNATRINPLMNSYLFENKMQEQANNRKFMFKDIFFGYQIDGMLYTNSVNTTYRNLKPVAQCGNGIYNMDARCRYWYQGANKTDSVVMFQPNLFYSDQGNPFLATVACQKLRRFSQQSQSDEVYNVLCTNLQLQYMQNYFSNFVKSTKQSYMIEPRSQVIVYDSNVKFNRSQMQTLTNAEFQHLQEEESAQLFNDTIKDKFNQFIFYKNTTFSLEKLQDLFLKQEVFSYQRNGTQNQVILNPVFIIDKLPQFKGIKSFQPKGFQVELAFLQITILSDEDLQERSKDLTYLFRNFYIGVSISLICLGILSIIITIFYSLKLINLFMVPINHLTDILKKIQIEDNLTDLQAIFSEYQLNTDEIFFSEETQQLYESFEIVLKMLQFTSENFFKCNQTKTLLNLHNQISFFKKFKNIRALGISHNNIGSIFLAQGFFFQALEHFSSSVLYAQYEIQEYCNTHNSCDSNQIRLSDYCFNEYHTVQSRANHSLINYNSSLIQQQTTQMQQNHAFDQNIVQNQKNYNQFHKCQSEPKKSGRSKVSFVSRNSSIPISIERNIIQNNLNLDTYQQELQNDEEGLNTIKTEQYNQCNYKKNEEDEQRINLLFNLFQRKKNYVTTILAFQEHIYQQKRVKKSQHQPSQIPPFQNEQKNSNDNNVSFNRNQQDYYYLWEDVEKLLEELLNITFQIPQSCSQQIDILCMISKCQFRQNKVDQANSTLMKSTEILKNIHLSENNKGKQTSRYNADSQNSFKKYYLQKSQGREESFLEDSNTNKQKNPINQLRKYQEYYQPQVNQLSVVFESENARFSPQIKSNNFADTNFLYTPQYDELIQLKRLYNNFNSSKDQLESQRHFDSHYLQSDNNLKLENNNSKVANLLSSNFYLNSNEKLFKIKENKSIIQNDQFNNLNKKNKNRNHSESFSHQMPKKKIKNMNNSLQSNQNLTKNNIVNTLHEYQDDNKLDHIQSQLDNNLIEKRQRAKTRYTPLLEAQNASLSTQKGLGSNNLLLNKGFGNKQKDEATKCEMMFNRIARPTAYQQYNTPKQTLEMYFNDQRNLEQTQYDLFTDRSISLSQEVLDCIINFTTAEFYLHQKDYISSSYILTNIIENSRFFMSTYPWKIISTLKHSLSKLRIQTEDIQQMYDQYQKILQFKVAIICSRQDDEKRSIQMLSLISDLINSVLIKNDDQIAIITIENQDKLIQTYMDFNKVTKIKHFTNQIISDIQRAITTKGVNTLLQLDTLSYYSDTPFSEEALQDFISNNQINSIKTNNYHKLSNNDIFQAQKKEYCFKNSEISSIFKYLDKKIRKNNSENIKPSDLNIEIDRIQMSLIKEENVESYQYGQIDNNLEKKQSYQDQIQKSQVNDELMSSKLNPTQSQNYEKQQIGNKDEYFLNPLQDIYNCQNQNQQEQNGQKQYNKENYRIQNFQNIDLKMSEINLGNNTENNIQTQLRKNYGDSPLNSEDIQQSQIKCQKNQQNINNTLSNENELFHLSIRKALNELFLDNIQLINIKKEISRKQDIKLETSNYLIQSNENQNNLLQQSWKCIIYFTNEIGILQNTLFEQLCKTLYQSKLQILVISTKKGSNFLENLPEKSLTYNNQIIFKIFYSTKSVLDFIQSQRNSIIKDCYPSFIQHY